NFYDLEHVTTAHARMTADEWMMIYERAWHLYYTPEHVETLLRRAEASGSGMKRLVGAIMVYYGSFRFERLPPLQCGVFRGKVRATRRPNFARENPFIFYPRRLWEIVTTHAAIGLYFLQLEKIRRRVARDARKSPYMDLALSPTKVIEEE